MAGSRLPIAIAHGEGHAEFASQEALLDADLSGAVALRYVDNHGQVTEALPGQPERLAARHHRPDHPRRPRHHHDAAPGAGVPRRAELLAPGRVAGRRPAGCACSATHGSGSADPPVTGRAALLHRPFPAKGARVAPLAFFGVRSDGTWRGPGLPDLQAPGVPRRRIILGPLWRGIPACPIRPAGWAGIPHPQNQEKSSMYKLCSFLPASHLQPVKEALFAAGAGRIGHDDQCCWQVEGIGQFRPLPGSQPFIGAQGQVEQVAEWKVEMVVATRCSRRRWRRSRPPIPTRRRPTRCGGWKACSAICAPGPAGFLRPANSGADHQCAVAHQFPHLAHVGVVHGDAALGPVRGCWKNRLGVLLVAAACRGS